jgi:flagellar hook-length control protein FliK
MARLHAAAQAAAGSPKNTDTRVQPQTPPQMQPDITAEAGSDEMFLDGASLKAERLSDPATRLSENSVRPATGPSTSGSASVADVQAGLSTGGGQNANAQTGGQQSGTGSGFAGTLNADLAEQWLDVLDMQDDKWTDQLVRRIDREMRSGGNGLDLELNPRNLGRLKVNLSVAHDQTNVVLRTETGAAAQMISDAESRLAQMLEAAGLKLGQFDAFAGGQNRGFGQRQDGQNGNDDQSQASGNEPESDSKTGDTELSDGLVNLTA